MNNTRTEMKNFETLDDNTVLIDGIKYQKVEEPKEEPKSLYEMLVPPYNMVGYMFNDGQLDWFCDNVEKWLNDNRWNSNFKGEYFSGWNDCIDDLQQKIK